MDGRVLVIIGGSYNLAFAAFHLLFWRLFRWREGLRPLTPVNRAIMQVLNLCLTFGFVAVAYLCFAHTGELLATPLGHAVLGLVALFWLLRALEQAIFFTLRRPVSVAFFVLFLAGCTLHAVPWLAR